MTIHPPLTESDFADGCGYTFRGVSVCEDESGSYVYSYGHIAKEFYVKVLADFYAEVAGLDEAVEVSGVRHVWARTVKPPSDPDGWWIEWPSELTAETPGTFPLTVVES